MNRSLKILAVIATIIIVVIAIVMFMTAGMTNVADKFFSAVKSDNYEEAYLLLSEDFKNSANKNQLKAYLNENALTDFKKSSWGSRSFSGGRGNLSGSITRDSGSAVPLSMSFLKSDNGWKIYSINKPPAGLHQATEPEKMPSEQAQVKLVSDAMSIFATANSEKSMAKFHKHISYTWQKQFSIDQLDQAYGNIYKADINLTILDRFSPQFDSKTIINEEGVLIISGHYPTNPAKVLFEQKYLYEGFSWKLIGFNISLTQK